MPRQQRIVTCVHDMQRNFSVTQEAQPLINETHILLAVRVPDEAVGEGTEVVNLKTVDDVRLRAELLQLKCDFVANEPGATDQSDALASQIDVHIAWFPICIPGPARCSACPLCPREDSP